MQLSEKHTLLRPVEVTSPPSITLGALVFHAKAEHHVTVFGYGVGRHVEKSLKAEPALRARIEEIIAAHDWSITPTGSYVHLVQPAGARPELHTLIELVDAKLADFFDAVRALVERLPDKAHARFLQALSSPPPPHVTLFTSDPAGKEGIGLNRASDLDDALDRAAQRAREGLRAYRIAPEVMPRVAIVSPPGLGPAKALG